MNDESPASRSDRHWRTLAALLTGVVVFNTFAYMVRFSNPVITCDYWYFVDAFVRKVDGGSLGALDFFVKRVGPDHAQPLKKLVLLLNVKFADLDLAFDAVIGFFFAAASVAFLEGLIRRDLPDRRRDLFYAISSAALAASVLTLNAGVVFGYSLVLLEFSVYLAAIISFATAWRAMAGGSWWPYLVSIIVLNLIADDSAALTTGAIFASCLILALKQRRLQPMMVATLAIAVQLLFLLAFQPHMPTHGSVPGMPPGSNPVSMLLSQPQWLGLLTIPLASTLAQLNQIQYWAPNHVIAATWALATVAAFMHAAFWYRATRGPLNQTGFVAIALMLLMYAYVAGIWYARVPMYGTAYLNSPRYCFFYLLSNIALVLMATVEYRRPMHRSGPAAAVVAVGLLLAVQFPLSVYTWSTGPGVSKFQRAMGRQVLQLNALPAGASPSQLPLLSACNAPPSIDTVRFMQSHQLNVFSEGFRQRHPLSADRP